MNDVLLTGLKAGELDLVLGPLTQTDETSVSEEIIHDEMVVMASSHHEIFQGEITMRRLLDYPWVLLAPSVASRQWLDEAFDRQNLPRPRVQITPTVINMILPLIEETGLLGFASKLNLLTGRTNLKEVRIPRKTMRRRMGLTYRHDLYLPPAAHRLIALLRRNRQGYEEGLSS